MKRWFGELDRLLRGERTHRQALAGGRFDLPLRLFVPLAAGLGASYGFFMGWYALSARWNTERASEGWYQLLAGMVKLPALFLLTLLVTFPSLYVFNALVGTRLSFLSALRLLIAAIVVNLAVAASLGTILAFFTLSTESYHFMVVLNVALLGVAGAVGLGFLLQTLRRLGDAEREARGEAPAAPNDPSAAGGIFAVWIIIYSLVGMQMGWLLRPFIGHPGMAFQLFRPRQGNFFQGLFDNIQRMLGG